MSTGVFIGSQGQSCGENLVGGGAVEGSFGRPGLGGRPTSLPWILTCCQMERYSCRGLDPTGYKVGQTARPPWWVLLAGASAYGVHKVRG
jgi:hypothetical protein